MANFDTLKAVDQLVEVGVPAAQAKAYVSVLVAHNEASALTDLRKADLITFESRIISKLYAALTFQVLVIGALVALLVIK